MAVKYTKKQKTEAVKRLKAGESASAVSRDLNIPRTTLIGWKVEKNAGAGARKKTQARAKEKSDSSTGEGIASAQDSCKDNGGEIATDKEQTEKKKNFSKQSWENIEKAQELIQRRLDRALDYEAALDEIVDMVVNTSEKDMSYVEKQALLAKLKKVKLTDIRDIVVMIGTLYDKQALANNEVNEKIGIAQDKPFEIVVTVKK